MTERIRHLARQSAAYSLGNIAVKSGGLVLAPILLSTEYLEVASYGYLALLLVSAQLGAFIVGLGISSGLLRFWTHPDYRERRGTLASTALLVLVLLTVLANGTIFLLFSDDIASLILDDAAKGHLIGLILAYAGFKVIGGVPLTVFRVQNRPLAYGAVQMLEVVLLVGLCFYWLVFEGRELEGVVSAYAAAAGITVIASCAMVFIPMTWKIDVQVIRPLINFGAPLALASLSGWVLNSSDRYLLKWLSDPVVIAEYDWASRVAGVINVLVVQSFHLAFVVVGLERLDENDVSLHKETFRHYVVWTGWAVLAVSVLTNDAMGLMALVFGIDQTYVGISGIVFLVGVGFWFYGTNQIVASALASAGKTGVVALCVGLAATVNVILNFALIPGFGGMGAAAATALAFLALVGTTNFFAEKRIPVGYEWSLGASVLLVIVGLFLLCELSQGWHTLAGVWFRIAVLAGYMPLLIMTGKYGVSEFRGGIRTAVRIVTFRRG